MNEVVQGPQPAGVPQRKGSAVRWLLLVIGVVVLGFIALRLRGKSAARAAAGPAASGSAAEANRVIPVTAVPADQRDVPIWVEGLGTVTPIQMVTVHSQVDGRLDRVFFKEGQPVKKGDPIAQVDPRPFTIQLHTAQAALARDEATARNAKLNLERYTTLRQQNLIPEQQLTDQKTLLDTSLAAVQSDQAQVENARLNLDYARIASPLDGVAGVRQVDPGNIVHANDATGIVVLTQLDPIAVVFTLPQDDLPRVSTALAAAGAKGLPVDAWSRDGAQKLATGMLLVIDNQVNQSTSTIRLKASFPNPTRVLWPSAFVKARLLVQTRDAALVVPAAAVQRGPQGTFVYVVQPDGTAAVRPVVVDDTQGETAILTKGVKPGENVVTDGQSQLRPGAKVQVRAPEKTADERGGTQAP